MGEEGVREAIIGVLEGDKPLLSVPFQVLELHDPMEPRVFVSSCIPPRGRDVIVAGLPRRLGEAVSQCTIQAAYTYVAEDLAGGRSRVKNRDILFLMNLLGVKQVRDVVEKIDSVELVVIVGPGARRVARNLSARCQAREVEPPSCNAEWLTLMARGRLRRYTK
ncbi:MAG: hypothetical protein F7C35_05505 [Desulfurococcales archaeon]|nr:hypothetical protein [Desulfurococcales archaeon]